MDRINKKYFNKDHYLAKQILTILLLVLYAVNSQADTLTVKQDGTGDYTKIQDAIDAANNATVILVYPGTYYENITYQGKVLTIGSLYLTTGADSLIAQTIIDGNHTGSCVRLENFETNCRLVGFTLQNGSGTILPGGLENSFQTNGGGVFIYKSSLSLEHCIINNNKAIFGGGVSAFRSDLLLKGNSIFKNHAQIAGGGIIFSSHYNPINHIIFDQIDLNSIYLNYASKGYDFKKSDTAFCSPIILDTGTIENPNHYYFLSTSPWGYPVNDLNIVVNNWKIEQSESDLYVNPEGNDHNSGLSPEYPLKTISFALIRIKSDSFLKKTIHLAQGFYSPSQTGEKLTLGLKSFVSIIGAGIDKTVISGENIFSFALLMPGEKGTSLKGFTFEKGSGHYYLTQVAGLDATRLHKIIIDSLSFHNCSSLVFTGCFVGFNDTSVIKNSIFQNNNGENIFSTASSYFNSNSEIYFELNSCRFLNNTYYTTIHDSIERCIPVFIYTDNYPDRGKIIGNIINTEITNTLDSAVSNLPAPFGIIATGNVKINLINSTIGDNFSYNQYGAPLGLTHNANVNVYNSILWGNVPNQAFTNSFADDPDSLYIYHSCVENGFNGINIMGPYDYVYYDDSTNIESDPLWLGYGDFPYNLSSTSPCIDAGTLDLPEGIQLPEKDLAGNPRIFNGKIDMGAYEWDPTVDIPKYRPPEKPKAKHLTAAPNPFDWGTYITAKWEQAGKVRIEVYNNGGLRVKTLKSGYTPPGQSEMQWTGDDENGNYLPAGIYHVVMYIDGKETESLKVVKK